ncbi:MAG: alpha/beta fold hydrolase [Acidobacteria bacterium]|nr:alpha/beta fold hydrolase [Acidobacteriota bacterium]
MLRFLNGIGFVVLLIVITQDYQIFAERMLQLFGVRRTYIEAPPGEAEDFFVTASDGEQISVRRWKAAAAPSTRLRVAVLHHGNQGTMDGYRTIPQWLAGFGITSYVYDYRGYGRSSGAPSERGIYKDAEAVWAEAVRRDGASPDLALSFAHSLGGGPASYLAARYHFGALLLTGTYTTVPEQARTNPLFGWLASFVRTEFPSRQYVASLGSTCLIVLHGGKDNSMPRWMSDQLMAAYRGRGGAFFAADPDATHDGIVGSTPQLAGPLLGKCPGLRN